MLNAVIARNEQTDPQYGNYLQVGERGSRYAEGNHELQIPKVDEALGMFEQNADEPIELIHAILYGVLLLYP